MPYCAVFGCKTNSSVDKNVYWFSFPKDQPRFKAWIHYCRRKDFAPSKHSRICGKHFTKSQYKRDPERLAELGYPGAKAALNDDAVPDVPVLVDDESPAAKKPRQAFLKRRKSEVLQTALDTSVESSEHTDIIDVHVESDFTDDSTTKSTNTEIINVISQKIQTDSVSQRTRRIQVGKPQYAKVGVNVGIQCDLTAISTIDKHRETHGEYNTDLQYTETGVDSDEENEEQDYMFHESDDPDYENDSFQESEDDDSEDEWETTNCRLEATDNPCDEKYYLVSETSLCELLSFCRLCNSNCIPVIEYSKGTMICTSTVCGNGHISKWQSQTCHNRLPWGNLVLSSAIMMSGNQTSKVLRLLNHMKVKSPSARTVSRLQSAYTVPAIIEEFDSQQADLLQTLEGKPVVLGGDGRCDSPGYSAKYGSYTLMDLNTSKILDIQLVQSNEVPGSTHMELEGLKRGIEYLTKTIKLDVKDLVTDRHVMIKKYMREKQTNINHFFDVWHIAKGISKKLETRAKKKNSEDIRPWIKSIVNHTYWVAASSGSDQNLKLHKWNSLSNHIVNKHEHDSELFPRCLHEELEGRAWLKEGSRSFKLIQEVITSPYLLKDLQKMSPIHQTYGLEVFHSVVNEFAPKSTHYFHYSMKARVYMAALHFNEDGKRQQATRKDGQPIWKISYPKAKKGLQCVVKPKRIAPTFDYVADLMKRILNKRTLLSTISEAQEDFQIGYESVPSLTESFEHFDKDDLVRRRVSRFNQLP